MKETYKRALQKSPTKEPYKRALQKRPHHIKKDLWAVARKEVRNWALRKWRGGFVPRQICPQRQFQLKRDPQKRPVSGGAKGSARLRDLQKGPAKETYTRALQKRPTKRPTKETYKRTLPKSPTKETYTRDLQKRPQPIKRDLWAVARKEVRDWVPIEWRWGFVTRWPCPCCPWLPPSVGKIDCATRKMSKETYYPPKETYYQPKQTVNVYWCIHKWWGFVTRWPCPCCPLLPPYVVAK